MKSVSSMKIDDSLPAAADFVRGHLGALYGCSDAHQIILCPGQLIGLIQIFHALRLRSILLTDEEYYTRDHFPGMKVSTCAPGDIARTAVRMHPDAVLMSIVGWKGKELPVRGQFCEIRQHSQPPPVLICDYAHAGAIGFPQFASFGADFICGDVNKWVLPNTHMSQLAFVWAEKPLFRKRMNRIFGGYYLAEVGGCAERSARWISPHDLRSAAEWLKQTGMTRNMLVANHLHNLERARRIARSLALTPPTKSCIIWLAGGARKRTTLFAKALAREDGIHVWRTSEGVRIMCASPTHSAVTAQKATKKSYRVHGSSGGSSMPGR